MSKIDDLHLLVRLLEEFEFPVSPILEYAIKEKMEQLASNNGDCETEESLKKEDNEAVMTSSVSPIVIIKKKTTILKVIRTDGTIIKYDKAADTLCHAIKEIGPEKVYALKIPLDGMYLVTQGGNPKYPTAQYNVGSGLFVNVHSNNITKKRQLEKIFLALDLAWKVEIIEVK